MTIANSVNPNPSVTVTSPPAPVLNPLDAMAASYDIGGDEPAPQPKPVAQPGVSPAPAAVPLQPAPSVPQPKHPAWLVTRAEQFGFHPLIVERFSTDELSQMVTETMHNQLASRADLSRQHAVQNPAAPGQADPAVAAAAVAAQPVVPVPPKEPEFQWGTFDETDDNGRPTGKKVTYQDGDIAAPIAHHIKELAKARAADQARIEKLEKVIEGFGKHVQANRDTQIEQEFDSAFSLIPEVFGSGGRAEVQGNQDFMARRKTVFGSVRGALSAMPPEVRAKLSIKDMVLSVTKSLFGREPAAAAKPAAPHPQHPGQSFANGQQAAPTNKQPSATPHGDARAKAAVQNWFDTNRTDGTEAADATDVNNEFF